MSAAAEVYNTAEWRELPRDGECVVAFLFGPAAGSCTDGPNHRHHVDPDDPWSRTVQVCASHHPKLEAALRSLRREPPWRRCTHEHRYPGAREACERRLNGLVTA
jgi:hypothetical protein